MRKDTQTRVEIKLNPNAHGSPDIQKYCKSRDSLGSSMHGRKGCLLVGPFGTRMHDRPLGLHGIWGFLRFARFVEGGPHATGHDNFKALRLWS